jgi:hypothetical protein
MKILLFIFIVTSLTSCGKYDEPYEVQQNIVNTGTLTIEEANHPTGWGQKQCFMCHQKDGIHVVDRLDGVNVDLETIRASVDLNGEKACVACHGANQ